MQLARSKSSSRDRNQAREIEINLARKACNLASLLSQLARLKSNLARKAGNLASLLSQLARLKRYLARKAGNLARKTGNLASLISISRACFATSRERRAICPLTVAAAEGARNAPLPVDCVCAIDDRGLTSVRVRPHSGRSHTAVGSRPLPRLRARSSPRSFLDGRRRSSGRSPGPSRYRLFGG